MLSTHIMQEVEAVCDRVIIIDRGKIKADDNKSGIYSRAYGESRTIMVEFESTVTGEKLKEIKGITGTRKLNDREWLLESAATDDIRPMVFRFAVDNGLTVLSMQLQEKNLEEVFRLITGDKK